jgi:hypothetical protein
MSSSSVLGGMLLPWTIHLLQLHALLFFTSVFCLHLLTICTRVTAFLSQSGAGAASS